ncbi:hypothetical protein WA556_004995 [Blastocystis sp. ATCC 50177/Nand II]
MNPDTPPEYAHDSAVVVQEIGNATFLQFDGNLLNLDDLAKYRKVFIANNKYVYQSDLGLSCIMLLTSFFTKSWVIILSAVLAVTAAILFYYSLSIISKSYNTIVIIGLFLSMACCTLLVYVTLSSDTNSAFVFIIIETFIYFILLSSLLYYATRLQTILRLVPPYLYPRLA